MDARLNLVREPDAGNLHVRFDEREVETEHGVTTRAPAWDCKKFCVRAGLMNHSLTMNRFSN